jgi:CIC family chloride channel protein
MKMAARAPLTAIFIVFEMTNDYRMIVPLMAGVFISLIVAERLHPESIYTLKLTRRGIHLQHGKDLDVMDAVRVDEVMIREPVTVPASMPIAMLNSEFLRTGRHGFPVLDDAGRLFGIVSLEDYRRAVEKRKAELDTLMVADIATQDMVTVHPRDSVGIALRRMAPRDLSRLPVVSPDDHDRLVGVVRRNDIVRAYEFGVLRREEVRNRVELAKTFGHSRVEFLNITLSPGSKAAGSRVADLHIPRTAVLVYVRRGENVIIPHGDTLLQEGDLVMVSCEREQADSIRAILQ